MKVSILFPLITMLGLMPINSTFASTSSISEVSQKPMVVLDVAGTSVTVGRQHSCVVTITGGAKCWGFNQFGASGDGTNINRQTPVDVSGLTSGVLGVAAGQQHTCALLSSGGVKCWGDNFNGQLGNGTTSLSLVPVDVSGLTSGVTEIAVGDFHSCALLLSGDIKCWGYNSRGQLGNGNTTASTIPVNVIGLTEGIKSISAGFSHTCALGASGTAKCWGDNASGQLGNGTTISTSVPVNVSGLSTGTLSLKAGSFTSCAITEVGGVKCWGDNGAGQLGNGITTSSSIPVDVISLTNGAAVIAPGAQTCAVLTNGLTKCWGFNFYGELGNGTTSNSAVPVDVVHLGVPMSAVAVGGFQTCAVTLFGGVKCWGRNNYGQLGNDSMIDSAVPVNVTTISGIALLNTFMPHIVRD